jgi:hypothetical protein
MVGIFRKPVLSVRERYEILLKMNDKNLMNLIDKYNAGELEPKTRLAMEIIDGGIGLPGESVVGSDLQIGVAA